jgi:hypothetical protein
MQRGVNSLAFRTANLWNKAYSGLCLYNSMRTVYRTFGIKPDTYIYAATLRDGARKQTSSRLKAAFLERGHPVDGARKVVLLVSAGKLLDGLGSICLVCPPHT